MNYLYTLIIKGPKVLHVRHDYIEKGDFECEK